MGVKDSSITFHDGKLLLDLVFSQSIVLELLGRLFAIYDRGEYVVQPELTRKHVHHDTNGVCPAVRVGEGRIVFRNASWMARESVQGIYAGKRGNPSRVNGSHLRIWRSPKWTKPRAFSAARAYNMRLLTNVISVGERPESFDSRLFLAGVRLTGFEVDGFSSEIDIPLSW